MFYNILKKYLIYIILPRIITKFIAYFLKR